MTKQYQSFIPTTPARSPRYNSSRSARPRTHTVCAHYGPYGDILMPSYLPSGFTVATNPEGKIYFVYQNEHQRFITEKPMYDKAPQEEFLSWVATIQNILKMQDISLPDSTEIYLDPEDEEEKCSYYIVDHTLKTLSWLESVDTDDIGLRPAVSEEHLGFALEELYWNHLEYYPAHDCGNLNLRMHLLSGVLVQCQTDQLTSEDSTFPFSAQKCQDFLRVVDNCKALEGSNSAHVRWSIARIWALICNHRFMTHYGQVNSRLSRDQLILETDEIEEGRLFRLKSRMLFNIPLEFNLSFEKLWADEIVYQSEWREFMPKCREEWSLSTALAFAILICNLIVLNSSIGPHFLSKVSTILSAASVLTGIILLNQHQKSGMWTAAQAASYLSCSRSINTGFQRLACRFSLPRGLLLWALVSFSIQVPFLFSNVTDTFTVLILGAVLAVGLIAWIGRMLVIGSWRAIRRGRNWIFSRSQSISLDETLPV